MSHLDEYDITFEWSDESETSFSCRAESSHAALAEAISDEETMIPAYENAELIIVTIRNNSAAARQESHEREAIYAE